jgi:hypothetical protein
MPPPVDTNFNCYCADDPASATSCLRFLGKLLLALSQTLRASALGIPHFRNRCEGFVPKRQQTLSIPYERLSSRRQVQLCLLDRSNRGMPTSSSNLRIAILTAGIVRHNRTAAFCSLPSSATATRACSCLSSIGSPKVAVPGY